MEIILLFLLSLIETVEVTEREVARTIFEQLKNDWGLIKSWCGYTVDKITKVSPKGDYCFSKLHRFLHINHFSGNSLQLETTIIGEDVETEKGWSYVSAVPFTEKAFNLIKDQITEGFLNAIKDEVERKAAEAAELAAWKAKQAAKEAEKQRALAELPTCTIDVISQSTKYGGHKKAILSFEKQVDKETVIKILNIYGWTTVAKKCYYPICPETVTIEPYGPNWIYEWHGEWDD